jgi:YYY domain-containing protein
MALLAALILFTPFYLTFHSLVGGRGFPLGLVTWSKTPLYSFLIIFGLFLLPLLVYVIMQGRRRVLPRAIGQDTADEERPGMPAQGETADRDRESRARRPGSGSQGIVSEARSYLSRVTLIILVLGPLIGFPLLVLLPLALYASLLAVEQADHPATAFVLWAFAVGCLICFGTEVVYIRDVFDSRLNTIFKFYYQAWLIWGVLAGYALWWVYTRAFSARRPGGYVFSVLFVLLLGGALVYPWLTAGQSFREGQRVGLAGKTPRDQTPDGAAAIAWLRANAPGDAAILEAVGDAYDVTNQGFGGVSASTGLATVLGWPGHEHQWRGGDPGALAQIEPRKADVETIYNTTDVGRARELLAKYKVDYIYVGAAERAAYRPEGLAKLAQLGTPAFQQGEVVVYRVK